jgi:hypothetical protein
VIEKIWIWYYSARDSAHFRDVGEDGDTVEWMTCEWLFIGDQHERDCVPLVWLMGQSQR